MGSQILSYYEKISLGVLQSHRAAEAGRRFWRLSCPTLCAHAGSAKAGCLWPPPGGFWYFQDWDVTASLENLCQCLITPYILVCTHGLLSCHWAPLRSISFNILPRVFICVATFPRPITCPGFLWSFLLSGSCTPPRPSHDCCCWPSHSQSALPFCKYEVQ